MHAKKNEEALRNASIYFGSEASAFHRVVSSGHLPEQEHTHVEEHLTQLLALTKIAIEELVRPKGGGKVVSGHAYAALRDLTHAVTELCEATLVVPAPLPGKARRL